MAALEMVADLSTRPGQTLGADKGFDTGHFVLEVREMGLTPHVAQNSYVTDKAGRRSAIDGRTTRHPGYAVSQRVRKRIEQVFGWAKSAGRLHQVRHRGQNRVGSQVTTRRDGLQPGSLAQVDRICGMSDPANCEVVGRWRITGSDTWDQDYLNLAKPARFTLDDAGHGKIAFGGAHLDVEYGQQIVFFRFAGFDEDNEVWGDGNAKIADDGTMEIEIHFVDGDDGLPR